MCLVASCLHVFSSPSFIHLMETYPSIKKQPNKHKTYSGMTFSGNHPRPSQRKLTITSFMIPYLIKSETHYFPLHLMTSDIRLPLLLLIFYNQWWPGSSHFMVAVWWTYSKLVITYGSTIVQVQTSIVNRLLKEDFQRRIMNLNCLKYFVDHFSKRLRPLSKWDTFWKSISNLKENPILCQMTDLKNSDLKWH